MEQPNNFLSSLLKNKHWENLLLGFCVTVGLMGLDGSLNRTHSPFPRLFDWKDSNVDCHHLFRPAHFHSKNISKKKKINLLVTLMNRRTQVMKEPRLSSLFFCFFFALPGGDASEDPNGQDDEKGSHAGASVAGPQRTGDDVVTLKGDGQDSQDRGVGHRQFHERHQFTFF
jgi:hypothetical protein